ncbi:hypothetical protein [Pseudomonas sp. Marseille-Q1929]|uniref:hypothetical protein n=1 Tax=Pseudomonas sp. Marseille-Q1929 TaxID=2730402 RepID=UPI001A8C25FA|nr:hypothetical protein [Pseudomonas sp. Marseille-Q1929]MBO0494079.1 hypothetical protein [Pseudomonas sp. Marseille-Q1929]
MPLSPSLAGQPLTGAVNTQFASRPTLDAVVQQLLTTEIARIYPSLTINLARTQLLTPMSRGRWYPQHLMTLILDFLANGTPLDFSDDDGRHCQLSDQPPTPLELADARPLDMQAILALIEALPRTLPAALQNALAAYWSEPSDSGMSRWQWLSDVLRDTLHLTVVQENDLMQHEREMLDQLINYPDLDQRIAHFGEAAVHAYFPMATFSAGKQTQQLLGPDLILMPVINGKPHILWCSLAGGYERYHSMDQALQYWLHRLERDTVVERITTQRYEADGHLFDAQSGIILNRQLQQLHNLKLGTQFGLVALRAVYQHITDPIMSFDKAALYTSQTLVTLRRDLPQWLSQATPAERMHYRHYSLKLASAKKRSEGLTFLSDLPDIRTYTQTALLNQLKRDEMRLGKQAEQLQPDDLLLTFHVAAGYPGGAGYVENVHMSLTDLAINNLQGRPRGQLTLAHRNGQPLPAWLTTDYILGSAGLIQQVDIGKTYPQMLRTRLLGDSDEERQRERRFAEQTVAQLPLLALESSLKQANGFTPQGAASVAAVVGERQLDGQAIVIRHLALVRKPQATADVVTNMYIIEPENRQAGPHILYRPLYADALLQFATRAQLLQAIATPGELQTSVLTWLSDAARPVYDNGGFLQPHYVRFGVGDEFELPEVPAPAALAEDGASDELLQFLANGKLMQFLYGANARALVDQAERESVSDAESRWRVFFEGAGLLFNTLLLPLARGPLMLTGWLMSLLSSASRDIPALNSQDPVTRELAWVDLLMNVGMLMFELTPTGVPPKRALPENYKWQALHSPLQRRNAEQWPPYPAAPIEHGAVMLGGDSPGLVNSVVDFSFANARQRLSTDQQQRLWKLQAAKPKILPAAVTRGPHTGLYYHLRDWYALVDTRWYQVHLEADGVVIVDPINTQRHGPYLQTDGQGNWSLDLRLRLRGGMPPKRIAAARERNAQRKQQLTDAQTGFISGQQQALQSKVDTAQLLMSRAASDPKYNDAARANTRKNFDQALHEQLDAYGALLDSRQERSELGIPMPVNVQVVFLENSTNNARKSVVVADMDRQALYAENPDLSATYEQALPSILLNQPRYAQFLKDMSQINERQIQALELKDRCLLELFNLGQPGLEAHTRLTSNRPDELSALSLKYLQLQNLKYLSRKNWRSGLFTDELDLSLDPLGLHLRTHSDLNLHSLSASDRMAVLDSLLVRYGQAVDALQGVALVHADELDNAHFLPLQALVASLYQDVVQQLAAEVKPPTEAPARPPKRALTAPGKPQKKVIKTRRQGFLIGDVKPAGSALPVEVVEVRSEQADQLLATYSQHEDGWDEVREAGRAPAQPTPPGTRALNVVKGDARKRAKALKPIIQRQEGYARVSRFPIEIQESLEVEATRYIELAGELERAIAAQPLDLQIPADRDLAAELRSASATLIAKGHELRTQRTLDLAPTDSHVAYLLEQDMIQLASLGPRVALRGEQRDFIQEYAVNDKRGFPLWYAHFHYAEAGTPKADYSVAHLKTKAHRTESYYSLLNKAQSPQGVVDVHRGAISRELAERWFLPLAT